MLEIWLLSTAISMCGVLVNDAITQIKLKKDGYKIAYKSYYRKYRIRHVVGAIIPIFNLVIFMTDIDGYLSDIYEYCTGSKRYDDLCSYLKSYDALVESLLEDRIISKPSNEIANDELKKEPFIMHAKINDANEEQSQCGQKVNITREKQMELLKREKEILTNNEQFKESKKMKRL